MKKVTILALHLGTGGVENAIASLSNMLSEKYDVEIICTYKLNEKPAFYINDKVQIKYLLPNLKPNKKELKEAIKSKNIIKILKEIFVSLKVLYLRKSKMKKAIKNLDCDFAISTRDFHNKLLGKYAPKGIIKIAEEHNHHNGNGKYINKIINSVKNIDYFMPVSKELTDFYAKRLENTNTKCVYIPHALEKYPDKISKLESKNIISVGRLSPEKGFGDLVDVFKLVNDKYPDWNLCIAGDGVEKENILNKIKENKLEDKVKMYGFLAKEELEKLLLDSSIYAMTSFTESFGLVLIEAESYGLPIVVMDSARGALEIVDEGINGLIVEDRNKEVMANKICTLIDDFNLRKTLGTNGREKSNNYKKEVVSKKWFNLLENSKEVINK